jgi:serine/threonine-protein kinase
MQAADDSGTQRGEPDLQVGKLLLGQFRVERRLGQGGMGVVYLARQEGTDRFAVVKMLRPERVDREMRERFAREGRVLAALHHPNIVTVYNVGALPDGAFFIAMEYVEGRELADVLEEAALPLERTLRIGEQLARALVAAHHAGVVHRDLKPQNVMLAELPGEDPDLVKVLDFGIAHLADPGDDVGLTATGVVIGTPQYISPEQAQGGKVGPPSDVYNLGLILYQCLSGTLPIRANSRLDYLRAHAMDQPTPLSCHPTADRVPIELAELIMRCLEKDPALRPSAPEALEILAALRLRALDPGRGSAPEPVAAPRRLMALVVTAMLAATALAAWAAWFLAYAPREPVDRNLTRPAATVVPSAPQAVQDQPPTGAEPEVSPVASPNPTAEPLLILAGQARWRPEGVTEEHRVDVAGFAMDRREVAAAEYAACVAARVCLPSHLAGRAESARADAPAVGVTLDMARTYCAWRGGRLPEAAEWIRAARGERLDPWPVPEEALADCCNLSGESGGRGAAAPVGTSPDVSLHQVLDLTGNVAEWVRWTPALGAEPAGALAMGGAWLLTRDDARIDRVQSFDEQAWFHFVGFRCAFDASKLNGDATPSRAR